MTQKEIAAAVCNYALRHNDPDTFVKSFAEYVKECLANKEKNKIAFNGFSSVR